MKLITLFLFAFLCGSAFAAVRATFTIDDFVVDSPAIVIVIPSNPTLPINSANFVTDDTILGGERDLDLTALTGGSNLVLSAGVSAGTFNSAAPKGASGESIIQYDGQDGSSDLNPSGLFDYYYNDFGVDNSFALRTNITADIATNVFFRVYSGDANSFCVYKQPIPGNGIPKLYTLNYVDFNETGSGCDFTNVGAFEVEVDLSQNVDIAIDVIEVIANAVSATPSPSRRPASPSRSRTPTPSRAAASASRTRTPTPSRAPASASRTRTPTPSRAPASASRTRTPSPSREPASASRTRTPTPSRVPASPSRTRTPSPSRVPASPSRTRTPSSIPRTPSNTPSPTSCICTCPELECFMFQYGEFTFNGRAQRNIIEEFAVLDNQENVNEEEGFDFLQLF